MTNYKAVYPSGKIVKVKGVLSFFWQDDGNTPGYECPAIDQGKPKPVIFLDPRAKIFRTDTGELVWDGTQVNPEFGRP